jgi:hypothetical protein
MWIGMARPVRELGQIVGGHFLIVRGVTQDVIVVSDLMALTLIFQLAPVLRMNPRVAVARSILIIHIHS